MTEREKMLSGELYDTSDSELLKMRARARELAYKYNNTLEEEVKRRDAILTELLGGRGKNCCMETGIRFDYGGNTYVGENFFANFNLTVLDCAKVSIGDNVMIGPNVTFATPVHPLLIEDRRLRVKSDGTLYDYEYAKPITVEDNVWIASNVVINGGVRIGEGAVIGSGSVVTRDIPAGMIAVGNPCRPLRKLTAADKMKMPE